MNSGILLLLAIFTGLLATSAGLIMVVWIRFSSNVEGLGPERSRRFFMSSLLALAGLSLALYALPKYQIVATNEGNFRAVLSAVYSSQTTDPANTGGLLIWYQTTSNYRAELDFEGLRSRIPFLEASTFKDFLSRNEASTSAIESLSIPQPYMIITPEDAIKIRQQERAFSGLAKLGWSGIFASSRPGFNAEQDQALVYVEVICGDGCGSGDLVLLSRINGTWQRIGFMPLWAS
jgi:hypothetical protein